jgi:hypothetical protein
MSRGRASNAANRSSRDVPTRSFARTCADGAGLAATGSARLGSRHPDEHAASVSDTSARALSYRVRHHFKEEAMPP